VIVNLVGNALDAVAEHARSVPANGEPFKPHVTVSTERSGDAIEIRVADNGPGIPDDLRAKIFEPFFTTKPTGSGTGLGLSMSYDIVTQGHGGTLTVEDAPDGGAVFVVTLPTDTPTA
ncbi:MAG: ATP-binding protein, partial [Bacteroidota bacterium]